jgi:sialidase-1
LSSRKKDPIINKPFLKQTEVFSAGEGGYKFYRIPSLIRAPDGRLLAFCEARKNGAWDHGDIDIALKESVDGGNTWSKLSIVLEHDDNTVGNPCPVVDKKVELSGCYSV